MAIVPYPHAAGHQRRNAEAYAEAGAAILIEDDALDADRLVEAAGLLADPARHAADVRRGPRGGPPGRRRRGAADLVMAGRRSARRCRPSAEIDAAARGSRPVTLRGVRRRSPLGTEIQRRIGVKTVRDEPLARFTTMRVGGPADLFVVAHNAFELRALVRFARARALPFVILGRGSNLVISDAGMRGLVIHARAEASRVEGERYHAEAGVPMARAATETQRAGLAGLEYGLAIPGTVGGAVWANAGAHGSDTAGVLESATVLLADGSSASCRSAELGFAYRHSRFKDAGPVARTGGAGPAEIVLGAVFHLRPADPAEIRARLDEIRRWRREHQPLGIPSAGSVFRNPPGDSAGRLIDVLGLKGHRIGGAVVSEKHANFIVNDRRGTAADVRALAEHVRARGPRAPWDRPRVRDRVRGRLVRLAARGERLMPVPPLGHVPAETPVAVVFGGPSAEHDVSIVSGTAIARRAGRRPATPWRSG